MIGPILSLVATIYAFFLTYTFYKNANKSLIDEYPVRYKDMQTLATFSFFIGVVLLGLTIFLYMEYVLS